ncbi:helix-turn-helix domain-containing protein [Streptomyces sp. NPDC005046]
MIGTELVEAAATVDDGMTAHARVYLILKTLNRMGPGLHPLRRIIDASGVTKSTVHRILSAGVTSWFRTYYEDEGPCLYFEADDKGWAACQVEVRGQDSRPVTAASLAEVVHLRDHADLAAMGRYDRQYGVLAEGPVDGWQGQP